MGDLILVAKDYLSQIKRLDMMINQKVAELYELKNMSMLFSGNQESERVKTSQDKDKLGNIVVKIIDKENEIDNLIDKYFDNKLIITRQIEMVEDNRYYNVLALRYINGWSYEKISVSMHYSVKQIKRLHEAALNEFQRMFSDDFCKMY